MTVEFFFFFFDRLTVELIYLLLFNYYFDPLFSRTGMG